MTTENNRISSLDYLKGVACAFVVLMHCEFPGHLGIITQCISRFSVPAFFMVSGYFCFKEKGIVNYRKKVIHIGKITLGATVFYVLLAVLFGGAAVTVYGLVKWLVFNEPVVIAGQMWFLFALLYDYILFCGVEKLGLYRLSFIAIPAGIAAYIFLAQGLHMFGIIIPNMIYRNFLIEGFPLFSLGYWLHRKQESINVSDRILFLILIVSTLLCPIERMIMGRDFGINIVTFPQVISMFLLCLNNPGAFKDSKVTVIGVKCSMFVYILHPAIWHFLEKLYVLLGVEENLMALYLMPILCIAIAIVVSFIISEVKDKTLKA